ncbi:MAG: DUF3151 domain-containing protein [Corynebacterium sp.]|nr:DUF3151 domain-containing protein [Corynebacterium sp.]
MTDFTDMLAPPPVKLPTNEFAQLEATAENVIAHPEVPALWAGLAAQALDDAQSPAELATAYAYARTGYHRSLDTLRANGWKGWGPVPFEHEPNQGVLRAIAMLALASRAIGDTGEYDRCRQMLSDADPASVAALIDV